MSLNRNPRAAYYMAGAHRARQNGEAVLKKHAGETSQRKRTKHEGAVRRAYVAECESPNE